MDHLLECQQYRAVEILQFGTEFASKNEYISTLPNHHRTTPFGRCSSSLFCCFTKTT
uniref:Uncharacterized protein n=1 Tax=Meloidogyne incognita TaxID=6306 RepID=A0A914NJA9_MELIC